MNSVSQPNINVNYSRSVKRIPRNETPDVKRHRLTVAIVREFVKEFPDDAVKIMRELVPNGVK